MVRIDQEIETLKKRLETKEKERKDVQFKIEREHDRAFERGSRNDMFIASLEEDKRALTNEIATINQDLSQLRNALTGKFYHYF